VDPYLEKIDVILKRNLSEKAFDLWIGMRNNISNPCWTRNTSSTGKYHKKEDGRNPTVAEHTFEMIYSADKIFSMFEGILNKNVIFLSIALHDSYKYGLCKTCQHTEEKHGEIISEIIKKNKKIFLQALKEEDVLLLENAVKFHDGKFSPVAKKNNFNRDFLTPEVMFLNILDMLGSRNCLKIIEDKNANTIN